MIRKSVAAAKTSSALAAQLRASERAKIYRDGGWLIYRRILLPYYFSPLILHPLPAAVDTRVAVAAANMADPRSH